MSKKEAKNTNNSNKKDFTNKIEGKGAIEALNEALGMNELFDKNPNLAKEIVSLREKTNKLEKTTEKLEYEITLLKELMARSLNIKSSKTLQD